MEVVTNYLLENWGLILTLLAFIIMLRITVFLEKRTIIRMFILIVAVFLLSIIVFTEFYLADIGKYADVRIVMMAIRYSATPIIIAFILYTLMKKARLYVLIPSLLLAVINVVSIFTGIVFSLNEAGELVRGPLGYLPYIAVGIYSVVLIVVLILQSPKQITDIIPIVFLAFALGTGLVFPFIVGKHYSKIFVTTIGIALFVYYVFLIFQLTKKDALTGLFNRQAYYASTKTNAKDITAFVSIDMNGLKAINDTKGHLAGDEALVTLAGCFKKPLKTKQMAYRIGGDEFAIICRRTSEEELKNIIEEIKANVNETEYSCSIGYCYAPNESKPLDDMIKESDEMMYQDKSQFYSQKGIDRRNK